MSNLKKYCFDEKKNKYEVYSKDDFAVIKTSITSDMGTNEERFGMTVIKYPEGFTNQNTYVLSAMYSGEDDYIYSNMLGNYNSAQPRTTKNSELVVQTGDILLELDPSTDDCLTLSYYPKQIGDVSTIFVKLVLMKMDI